MISRFSRGGGTSDGDWRSGPETETQTIAVSNEAAGSNASGSTGESDWMSDAQFLQPHMHVLSEPAPVNLTRLSPKNQTVVSIDHALRRG
jgi:hypothetical protein